jgi:hypothetical protein
MNRRRLSKPIRVMAWGLVCLVGLVFCSGIELSKIPDNQWGLNVRIGPDREELAWWKSSFCMVGYRETGYRVEIGRIRITHYTRSGLFFW